MENKVLPIGTVVLLNGGSKKVMITGFYPKAIDEDTVYDYNGCIFPEGFMENQFVLFNSNQIERIFYKGLENDESKKYAKKITAKRKEAYNER